MHAKIFRLNCNCVLCHVWMLRMPIKLYWKKWENDDIQGKLDVTYEPYNLTEFFKQNLQLNRILHYLALNQVYNAQLIVTQSFTLQR